jgi:hypothetical protein
MESAAILTTAQAFDYYKDTDNLRNTFSNDDSILQVFTCDLMIVKSMAVKENTMRSQKYDDLVKHFYDNGYDEAIRFMLESRKEQYLITTENIKKSIELMSLTKREKSIVQYLNYLEDKKRAIVPSYSSYINNTYDGTNVAKLSSHHEKYMRATISSLTQNELTFYKSFIGIVELDTAGLTLERAKVKARKIRALYTAKLPHCNIDFKEVAVSLNSKKIPSSEQDVIAFLSLITELSYDGINVNIPASFWESMFSKRHIKNAKQVFHDIGILKLVYKPITGFKSAGYKINLYDKLNNNAAELSLELKITSIRTLEKLNRIKRYKGNFNLNEKIDALQLIRDLRLKDLKKLGQSNRTNIFLESGKVQILINDLKRMVDIMNDNRFYHIALPLGIHLTTYFNNINEGHFKDYRALRLKETNENTI